MRCEHSRCTESVDNPVPVVHDARMPNKNDDVEDPSSEQGDDDLGDPVHTDKHNRG